MFIVQFCDGLLKVTYFKKWEKGTYAYSPEMSLLLTDNNTLKQMPTPRILVYISLFDRLKEYSF